MSEPNRLEINWPNALGGALAAVSAAVLLSTLGTAGTLIGAALGSLLITIGGAVYAHSMRVAHERLLARRAMLARISAHRGGDGSRTQRLEAHDDEPTTKESRLQMLRTLPWKRIIAVSAAIFVVAMGVIVGFELTTGKTVSQWTGGSSQGGTSVPGIGGGSEPQAPSEPEENGPPPQDAPADEPAESDPPAPVEEEPTPTETGEPSPVETPTDAGTAAPTATP